MNVIFCKISWMKYYKGVIPGKDDAYNGGSYVLEHGEGHEQYNFLPAILEDNQEYCLGFVETKSTRNGKRNELHIEKVNTFAKNEPMLDDVLVIWCATSLSNTTSIVGWYKHATLYRTYQSCEFDNGYIQNYNVLAKKEDCFLLPEGERNRYIWKAPVAKKRGYGFGQSLIWYGQEDEAQAYISECVKRINEYCEDNWIDTSAL